MTVRPCVVCGTATVRPTCTVMPDSRAFCSTKCHGTWRTNDPATRDRLKSIAKNGRAAWTDASLTSYKSKMTGDKNPAWKGGVTIFKTHGNYAGVKYVRCPPEFLPMARKDGYVMEHRLIVAGMIGRCLSRTETVHHVNHDPTDNRQENLELFATNKDHKLYEHHGSPLPIWSGSKPSTTPASSGA